MTSEFTVAIHGLVYLHHRGETASSEVLRLTVEIAEAAKKEDGAAEALVLQAEMEEYTSDAQNFSKGLEMVLGDVVGTGTETGSTQP